MTILGVESSASAASAAILKDGKLISEVFSDTGLTHSQTLMPMIKECLVTAQTDVNEIDKIAVSVGPGSFTGIRIGVATVKGIAFTNNIPCVPVSTLEAMAMNIPEFNGIVCSVMDARCKQVYNAMFDMNNSYPIRICDDRALSLDNLKEEIKNLKKYVIFVGDGAKMCYNYIKSECDSIFLPPSSILMQRASGVALCAEKAESVSPNNLVPVYLRLPQAERELMARKKLS